MKIEELTSNTLTIIYRRSLLDGIGYFLAGGPLLAIAIYVAGWGWSQNPNGEYSGAASVFLVLLEIGSLAGAIYFLSTIFDRMTYSFDKASDMFLLRGRKSFFKRWSIGGAVSGISNISCEITGTDENTNSEIYLTYHVAGAPAETLRCGTGELRDDEAITDTIKTFLALGGQKRC